MRSLPLYTVLLLSALVLVWNYTLEHRGPGQADFVVAAAVDSAGVGPETVRARTVVAAEIAARLSSELVTLESRAARRRLHAAAGDKTAALPGATSRLTGSVGRGSGDDVPEHWVHRIEIYADGARRAEGYLADGLRAGRWVEWFEEGPLKSEGSFVDGEPEGEWLRHHKTGGIHVRETYVAGELEGTRACWDKDGVPVEHGTFEQGLPVHEWVQWYSNGQVRSRGSFVDGKRTGHWEFYDYDGRVDIRTGHYTDGRRDGDGS